MPPGDLHRVEGRGVCPPSCSTVREGCGSLTMVLSSLGAPRSISREIDSGSLGGRVRLPDVVCWRLIVPDRFGSTHLSYQLNIPRVFESRCTKSFNPGKSARVPPLPSASSWYNRQPWSHRVQEHFWRNRWKPALLPCPRARLAVEPPGDPGNANGCCLLGQHPLARFKSMAISD